MTNTTSNAPAHAAPRHRVLVVDDDLRLRDLLKRYLTEQGFAADTVPDGVALDRAFTRNRYDLVVLDVMLPNEDGFAICQRLRASSAAEANIPIIMLTAKGDDVDRIGGLEIGADDYLSKPFNPRELVARIRAILRRVALRPGRGSTAEVLDVGPIRLNMATHQATVDGQAVVLTGAEFRVLEILMRSAGQVLSRDLLTESALGRKLVPYDRSIDTHISNLRRKLNLEAGTIPELKNVRGAGYMLAWASPG